MQYIELGDEVIKVIGCLLVRTLELFLIHEVADILIYNFYVFILVDMVWLLVILTLLVMLSINIFIKQSNIASTKNV